ncbi:hypothetical protein MLD38_010952 [Melastoma candidum]|uniref:Uncharacterized protein n=1 Tax=Melastoma candidum TaxID=119954 RepID=A0ACB9R4K7_9MYRT|nr:hypothetical protein MLD38_010952 [Melastoma candidum]
MNKARRLAGKLKSENTKRNHRVSSRSFPLSNAVAIPDRRTPPKLQQPPPQQVTAAVRIAPWTGVAVFFSDLLFR